MARRGSKSSAAEQPKKGSTAPLQGALTQDAKDNPENIPLQMLMTRLDDMQRQQEQQSILMNKVLTATDDNYNKILTEVSQQFDKERRATEDGMVAMREEFQKFLEEKQLSAGERQNLVKEGLENAKKQMERDKVNFKKALKDMPKGEILNDETDPVLLIINGHPHLIALGRNKGVPQVYVDEWEHRKLQQQNAIRTDLAFQRFQPDGSELHANDYRRALGKNPMWNEDTGVMK
jgi:hypothetical protein